MSTLECSPEMASWILGITEQSDRYVRRAMAAYFRAGGTEQPELDRSGPLDGCRYVALNGANGPIAVYRILSNDRLKRLKRWPKSIRLRAEQLLIIPRKVVDDVRRHFEPEVAA